MGEHCDDDDDEIVHHNNMIITYFASSLGPGVHFLCALFLATSFSGSRFSGHIVW